MFSSKTEELIRRLKRVAFANQKAVIFKPVTDDRYSKNKVVSHDSNEIESIPVHSSAEIEPLSKDVDVIALDEAQFFDDHIVSVCNNLANSGKRVIIAGLDMDFEGNPFGPMPNLMATARSIYHRVDFFIRCLSATSSLMVCNRPCWINKISYLDLWSLGYLKHE